MELCLKLRPEFRERSDFVTDLMDPWLPLCNLSPFCFKTLPTIVS